MHNVIVDAMQNVLAEAITNTTRVKAEAIIRGKSDMKYTLNVEKNDRH